MFGGNNRALTGKTAASILGNVKEEVLVLSKDLKILWANRKIMDVAGLKKEDVFGCYCYKITHHLDEPCKPPHDVCPILEVLVTGKPVTVTHTHFDKESNKIYVEVSAYPLKNKWGKITHFVHIARDITAQVEITETLKYTDSIIANMIDTLIVVDPDGRIKTVNKAMLDLLGYTEVELIGEPVGKIFREEEQIFFKGTKLRNLIQEGSVRDFEMTYKTKIGEKIPVSFTGSVMRQVSCPNRDKPTDECPEFKKKGLHCEKILGVIGVARDMRQIKALISNLKKSKRELHEWSETLEKKVEERTKTLNESQEATLNILEDLYETKKALEVSTENFSSIVEKNTDGILIVSNEGIIRYANPAVAEIFGYKKEHLSGEMFGFPIIAGKTMEIDIIRRTGEVGIGEMSVTETEWKGESVQLLFIHDITEAKQMLEELKQTQQQQLQLKDQFLSHVSHELRSPLTAVYQFVTILLDGLAGDLSIQQREYLEIALRNTEQLKTMIHNLLEITRAQTGKMSVEPKNISLKKVISELTDTLRMNAENKHIMLSADIPKGLPNVYADPDRVKQLIINLVGNAIKFTHENGSITVGSQVFKEDPKFLCVSVTDTGCGISPEESEKVFKYLYQTKTTSEVSRKGLGLGLYICKELVFRHGGRIWMKSQVGKGSTFFFTLPIFSLSSLLEPILTLQNLKRGSVALVNIEVYPVEKRQLTKIDERVLLETWDVLKGCVLPVSDVVLPRIGRTKSGEIFFIVACADQKGVEVMECRIKTQLARYDELRDADLYPKVSFTIMDISPIMENKRLERVVKDISTRIENLVKKMIHKEKNL